VGRKAAIQASLRRGLKVLGPEVVQGLRFVCSDLCKADLQVIAAQAGQAMHVLDRLHITRPDLSPGASFPETAWTTLELIPQ
jgi:transposase